MHKQQGIVLIAALIILIICSFIAVGVGRFAISSKQDASGQFSQLRGYVDATAALSRANDLLYYMVINDPEKLDPATSNAITTELDTTAYWWRDNAIWQRKGTEFTEYTSNTGIKPRFRIEQREFIGRNLLANESRGSNIYRVITRGVGEGGQATNVIESYFTVPAEKK